jgi:hypothetical protein
MKRLLLSLAGGIICAIICYLGRKSLIEGITTSDLIASSFGNRILIGLVIGISSFRIHYLLNGIIIGFLVSLSYSIAMLVSNNIEGFISYTIAGTLFGLLIELYVTKWGKAPIA